jgi:hypothetical protein
MSDLYLRAMLQSMLGGSTSKEDMALLAELCRRIILSGVTISTSGVWSLGLPTFGPSAIANLGTGVIGDLPYFDSTVTLARIADVATGNVLLSGGVGAAPAYGKVTDSHIAAAGLTNAAIAAAAAIAYTKLALTGSIVDADVSGAAAITWTKVSKTGSSLADLTTRSAGDLSSGIIPAARLGTPFVCDGRLTLTSGTPVTTSDVTAATTLYFTPYKGSRIALYDGSGTWTVYAFTEKSIAIPATTSQMYDVFMFDNSGTPALELLAWTNDTTRATALTTQDGVLVKTGATTRRYLGSVRTTTVSGQTEDSFAKRFVWNYYNRQKRVLRVFEATDSWTYTTAAWRQANNSTVNQLAVVVGVAEVPVEARVQVGVANSAGGVPIAVSIREDSVGNPAAISTFGQMHTTASFVSQIHAMLTTFPAVGYHIYIWQEYSNATGTTTWYGDNGAGNIGPNSGIVGSIEG